MSEQSLLWYSHATLTNTTEFLGPSQSFGFNTFSLQYSCPMTLLTRLLSPPETPGFTTQLHSNFHSHSPGLNLWRAVPGRAYEPARKHAIPRTEPTVHPGPSLWRIVPARAYEQARKHTVPRTKPTTHHSRARPPLPATTSADSASRWHSLRAPTAPPSSRMRLASRIPSHPRRAPHPRLRVLRLRCVSRHASPLQPNRDEKTQTTEKSYVWAGGWGWARRLAWRREQRRKDKPRCVPLSVV